MDVIKVGIIEDNKSIRSSLQMSIRSNTSMVNVFAFESVEDAISHISEPVFDGVDVILLDIGLPGIDGIKGIQLLKQKLSDIDIIMLTTYDESEKIFEALCNGAKAYLSKKTSLKQIMETISVVFHGGSYMNPSIARKLVDHMQIGTQQDKNSPVLTKRQTDIVNALKEGLSYKMIADKHQISIDTVRTHIKKVYRLLEVNSKIELVNLYSK